MGAFCYLLLLCGFGGFWLIAPLSALRSLRLGFRLGFPAGRAFGFRLALWCFHQTAVFLCGATGQEIGQLDRFFWLGLLALRRFNMGLIIVRRRLRIFALIVVLIVILMAVAFLTLGAFAITLCLPLAVLTFLFIAALIDLALRFGQKAQIMLRVLLKILCRNAVIAQVCITGKLIVFLNHLLGCAAHFAFGTAAVEYAVDDISAALRLPVAVILGPGP